ncbi:hypothetical protein NUACC21_73820 [Scytonema sp. NUACC21]
MEKMNFGFWRGSPTLLKSRSAEFQLPQLEKSDGELTQQNTNTVVQISNNCEIGASKHDTKTSSDLQLEQLLSNLLRYGVLIASTLVFVGGLLYLIRNGHEPAQYQFFQGEPPQLCSPSGVIDAVLSGSYRGIIQLGLLLLVATPILRVILSLFFFLRQRQYNYVVITLIVLTALIYSLIGAYY